MNKTGSKKAVIIGNSGSVIQFLTQKFGPPVVQRKFSIFTFGKDNKEIHLHFYKKQCQLKLVDPGIPEYLKPMVIENKNTKTLLKTLLSLGFTKCTFGKILVYEFPVNNGSILVMRNTFIGDVVECTEAKSCETEFLHLAKRFRLKLLNDSDIKILVKKNKNTDLKPLFDSLGVLNAGIRLNLEELGFDISAANPTLRSRLTAISNDYSCYESAFEEITKTKLVGKKEIKTVKWFKPISIIIPCFNSEDTILQTLYSIEAQKLPKKLLKEVEVIVVDDGSEIPAAKRIYPEIKNFTFRIKIIRLEKNQGLSSARNIGVNLASNEHIIFLDSDIIIGQNYLLEHSVRARMFPDAIFLSFKKNIDRISELTNIKRIQTGVKPPENYDDIRFSRFIHKEKKGLYKLSVDSYIEMLNESNYFKNLGYGRHIGLFDLPSMVVGHNMSLQRKTIIKSGFFSNYFSGWGMEDAFFGARVIADGNFVIPVLSTGVYHINHPPRSGSEKKKQRELESNLKLYDKLLDQEI